MLALIESVVTDVPMVQQGVLLTWENYFFKWTDFCIACPMFFWAAGIYGTWMLLAIVLIIGAFSGHPVAASVVCTSWFGRWIAWRAMH
jgi:hypothetical protein